MNSPRSHWTFRVGGVKIAADGSAAVMLCCPGGGPPRTRQAANGDGRIRDLTPLREQARRDSVVIEIESAADGTRLAWSLPLRPVP